MTINNLVVIIGFMKPDIMKKALECLDQKLAEKKLFKINLLVGGGGAMGLAYKIPLNTADIDAVPFKSDIEMHQLEQLVKIVGRELAISPDWLNPYFGTFLMSLPSDYGDRLVKVYSGTSLKVYALGLNDLMVMKCFAAREKDIPHVKILLKKGADIDFVQAHLETLVKKNIPGASEALDFLLAIEDDLGI